MDIVSQYHGGVGRGHNKGTYLNNRVGGIVQLVWGANQHNNGADRMPLNNTIYINIFDYNVQ